MNLFHKSVLLSLACAGVAQAGPKHFEALCNRHPVPILQIQEAFDAAYLLKNYSQADSCEAAVEFLNQEQEIVLNQVTINSLQPFSGLDNLKKLWIKGPKIAEIAAVGEIEKLEDLWLIADALASLEGIQRAENLQSVYFKSNELTDLHQLENLKLSSLILDAPKLKDAHALGTLSELTTLHLYTDSLSDFSFLSKLPKLKSLWISSTAIHDFSPLRELSNLEELWISSPGFKTLESVAVLPNLKSLTIANSSLKSLAPLTGFASKSTLETFQIINSPITDIDAINSLRGLENLSINGIGLDSLSKIDSLPGLKSLDASYNSKLQVGDLSRFAGLESLSLNSIGMSDATPFSALSNLNSLSLANNSIADVSAITQLKKLESLNLASNQVQQLSNFVNLSSLKFVFLDNNQVGESLSNLIGLENIEVASFANTGISSKASFSSLPKLSYLDVSKNQISDLMSVIAFPELEWLDVSHNKIQNYSALDAKPESDPRRPSMWMHTFHSTGNPNAFDGQVPTSYMIRSIERKSEKLIDTVNAAISEYERVANLNAAAIQTPEDLACLKIYFHYKKMGQIKRALENQNKADQLTAFLTPICVQGSSPSCSEDPIKATFGVEEKVCGNFKGLNQYEDFRIGKSLPKDVKARMVKVSDDKLLSTASRLEVLETQTLMVALATIKFSTDGTTEDIAKVVEEALKKVNSEISTGETYLRRIDLMRFAVIRDLVEIRSNLQDEVRNANSLIKN